eukprot:11731922-Alexandrium_andersonii.AAC.1
MGMARPSPPSGRPDNASAASALAASNTAGRTRVRCRSRSPWLCVGHRWLTLQAQSTPGASQ